MTEDVVVIFVAEYCVAVCIRADRNAAGKAAVNIITAKQANQQIAAVKTVNAVINIAAGESIFTISTCEGIFSDIRAQNCSAIG